mmetsp:Transcript_66556/g.206034  ORF Transcript_66556/g.206034 Transcript_66556/m.206034 type:complete len:184 (+) Transcript_66556:81-632(+)
MRAVCAALLCWAAGAAAGAGCEDHVSLVQGGVGVREGLKLREASQIAGADDPPVEEDHGGVNIFKNLQQSIVDFRKAVAKKREEEKAGNVTRQAKPLNLTHLNIVSRLATELSGMKQDIEKKKYLPKPKGNSTQGEQLVMTFKEDIKKINIFSRLKDEIVRTKAAFARKAEAGEPLLPPVSVW